MVEHEILGRSRGWAVAGLDHHTGQPTSLPTRSRSPGHRAHRNASHAPQRECKTSPEPSAHLGGSCTLSRQEAAGFCPPARTPQRLSHRLDPCLHGVHWFCITRPCTRVPVYKSEWVAAVLWVEGERATGTASQESNNRPLRAVFGKAWTLHVCERRGVTSGQWKTNTQTDADVLTTAEALCENKTGRNEEKLVNKQKHVRLVAPGRRNTAERRSSRRSRGRLLLF